MDIYNFINSKDIARYLREVKYNFSTVAAAHIVYQCRTATLKQKIDAWQEIIKCYPDCRYEGKETTVESVHEFLRNYIAMKKRWLNQFYSSDDGGFYIYQWTCIDIGCTSVNMNAIFSNYEKCYEHFMKETLIDKVDVSFRKIWLDTIDEIGKYMKIGLNDKYEVTSVYKSDMSEEEKELEYWFDKMWVSIPTPFKRGDVVCVNNRPLEPLEEFQGKPFVLNCMATWGLEEFIENGFDVDDEVIKNAGRKPGIYMREKDELWMWIKGYVIKDDEIHEVFFPQENPELDYYIGEFDEAEIIREKMRANE